MSSSDSKTLQETNEDHLKEIKRVLWTIPNSTKDSFNQHSIGIKVDSPTFAVDFDDDIIKWSLLFYPNGDRLESKSHVSLYLKLIDSTSMYFNAALRFGIVDENGIVNYINGCYLPDLEKLQIGCGTRNFISHDILFEESSFIIDDNLTVFCELTLTSTKDQKNSRKNRLASDFQEMLESELFTDFELMTNDDVTLKTHKSILCARSPVFYGMLTSDSKEGTGMQSAVVDLNSTIMKEILRFIYCGYVRWSDEIAYDLIFAAEQYQINDLKLACLENIIATLENRNVIDTFLFANGLSNAEKLKNNCLDMINKRYHMIIRTEQWKTLPAEHVTTIQHERLCRSTNTIYI